jgi:hypothetical protein
MRRLYILIDTKLEPVYGCVQGGHAVAQYLLEHPEQKWNNNYLIYLRADVQKWITKLSSKHLDFSVFCEPDLDNIPTAIAIEDTGRMFRSLKLVE